MNREDGGIAHLRAIRPKNGSHSVVI